MQTRKEWNVRTCAVKLSAALSERSQAHRAGALAGATYVKRSEIRVVGSQNGEEGTQGWAAHGDRVSV